MKIEISPTDIKKIMNLIKTKCNFVLLYLYYILTAFKLRYYRSTFKLSLSEHRYCPRLR